MWHHEHRDVVAHGGDGGDDASLHRHDDLGNVMGVCEKCQSKIRRETNRHGGGGGDGGGEHPRAPRGGDVSERAPTGI